MKRLVALATLLLPSLCAGQAAPATPGRQVLRIATIAPDGTAWAREFRAWAREVEAATRGELGIKLYFGGIAGNELETAERMKRGQLDGAASGGMLCQAQAPSWKVTRMFGLFESREETSFTLGKLKPTLDDEFRKSGTVLLGWANLGREVLMTPRPIQSASEIGKFRLWRWDLDDVGFAMDRLLGWTSKPGGIEQVAKFFERGEIDGVIGIPSAFLAFQWHRRGGYFLDTKLSFLYSCMVLTLPAFDRLPVEHQKTVMGASAKMAQRIDDLSRAEEQSVLAVLGRQGMPTIQLSPEFRSELRANARKAGASLDGKVVPKALVTRVQTILEEYRATHAAKAPR